MDNYPSLTGGLGAHNSFVHAYTELGFLGGTLFAGSIIAAVGMFIHISSNRRNQEPCLAKMGTYLIAILLGYAAGMLSSTRCYAIPTYQLLGLVVVYIRLSMNSASVSSVKVTPKNVARIVILSVIFLLCIKVYVMASVHFDSGV